MSGAKRFERSGQPSAAKTVDWLAVEHSQEFKELVRERRRFLVPATIVFLVGSIGYLLLAAFVPGEREAVGDPGPAHVGAHLGVPTQGRPRLRAARAARRRARRAQA